MRRELTEGKWAWVNSSDGDVAAVEAEAEAEGVVEPVEAADVDVAAVVADAVDRDRVAGVAVGPDGTATDCPLLRL